MADKKVFDGIDMADAIQKACKKLNVTQEKLDIEVVRTGTKGVFGFLRRSARIKVSLKAGAPVAEEAGSPVPEAPAPVRRKKAPARAKRPARDTDGRPAEPATTITPEVFRAVEEDLVQILERMGFPATVTASQEDDKVLARIASEYEEEIVGPEGQALDGLQFLIRKMISRRFPGRLLVTLDVGNFRERRRQELTERATELAAEVKETGKTRMMPPLNPAERRIVHMALQQDTTIRSRSVGDGIFKKVLIYLPSKGRRKGPRRRKGAKQESGVRSQASEQTKKTQKIFSSGS